MRALSSVALVTLCVGAVGCGSGTEGTVADPAATPPESGVINIVAEDYSFMGPPTFPSGWVHLRFVNQGKEPHFVLIWKLPEGRTFDDYASEVANPFNELYPKYRAGELDKAAFFEQLIATIPEWFYSAIPFGGPGFTAAGRTSETTIYLEPGDNYVMECYVRAMIQDDTFHGNHGMLRPLIVTEESSGMGPPASDVEIVLSSFEIALTGDLSPGPHTVRVRVEDTPEGFIRHNVQLVALEGDMTGAQVAPWLDWVDAMLPPAPAEFLGGAGQTVAGRESYVNVDLVPGRYAWVSEGFGTQGMVHEFTVE